MPTPVTQSLSLHRNVVHEESFVNWENQCAELIREHCRLQTQLEKMTETSVNLGLALREDVQQQAAILQA